jgi:hypothetical protein
VPGSDIHACLTYLRRVVQVLQPVHLAIYAVRDERPVVVFTDASFQRSTMTGELGIVVWVPTTGRYFYSSSALPSWIVALWTGIEERDTFISPAEALVAACAYLTFPDLVRGRLVHHFVDNDAAKSGLIKGTSSSPHTARVLLDYHVSVGCEGAAGSQGAVCGEASYEVAYKPDVWKRRGVYHARHECQIVLLHHVVHVWLAGGKHHPVERLQAALHIDKQLGALVQCGGDALPLLHDPLDELQQVLRQGEMVIIRGMRQLLGLGEEGELAGISTSLPRHTVPVRLVSHGLLHGRIIAA